MSPEQTGWVAGLIEGEGSFVSQTHANGRSYLGCKASSTDEFTARQLQGFAGGHVYGPYQPKRGPRQPVWTWQVWEAAAYDALVCAVWHLLSPRRQARVLEKYDLWRSGHGRRV